MKNFQSTTEGVWVEQVTVQLTEDEKQLMGSQKKEDTTEKQALFNRIKEEREQPTTAEKSDYLTTVYTAVKSQLKETDLYELISCNLNEKNGWFCSGIINFKANGEHKQLRF